MTALNRGKRTSSGPGTRRLAFQEETSLILLHDADFGGALSLLLWDALQRLDIGPVDHEEAIAQEGSENRAGRMDLGHFAGHANNPMERV